MLRETKLTNRQWQLAFHNFGKILLVVIFKVYKK